MPEMLECVAEGDGAAVDACLDRYGDAVWRMAVRFLGDGPAAYDATREIFLLLWTSAHRFDPQESAEPVFVMNFARRHLLDAKRAGARRAAMPKGPPGPAGSEAWGPECPRAGNALRGLAAEERGALLMAVGLGLDHAEVGAATGVPAETARARVRRGLRRVAEAMAVPGKVDG